MDTKDSVPLAFIARPADTRQEGRHFPGIAADLFDGPNLVARLTGTPMRDIKRRIGLRMNADERLSRLMLLYREAFEAEMAGRAKRADFFWREFHDALHAAWNDMPTWIAAASSDGAGEPDEQVGLDYRRWLVGEIFMDSHIGFYNGRLVNHDAIACDDRAFIHARYAASLADLARYKPEAVKSIVVPPSELQIERCRAAGKWEQALAICREMVERFSNWPRFERRLAELHFEGALHAQTNGTTNAAYRRDADRLEAALGELEQDRRRHPYDPELYTAASQLQLLRAVKLANSNQLAEALAAVKWAHAYLPDQQQAHDVEAELKEIMVELKNAGDQLVEQLRANPNATLNAEGQLLANEAALGFVPATNVESSEEAREIRRQGTLARGAKDDDEAADKQTWSASLEHAPLLNAHEAVSHQDRVPLDWWLLSRRDLPAKAVAAAACCMLVFAGFAASYQAQLQWARSQSYSELVSAIKKGDDDGVLRAAESFLGTRPWGTDGREAEVWQQYERALPRWFEAKGHTLDAPAREHLARFQLLAARTDAQVGR